MEAQLHRPTTHDDDPHLNVSSQSVMEGDNQHGEKKSVLKKVKDKAKKIKDKIKHGGHAHDGEDYDDEDEETVVAPDVHAAPIKEDAFISGTNLPKQTGLNLEDQVTPPETLHNPNLIGNVGGPRDEIGNDPLVGSKLENESTPLDDLLNPNVIGNAGARSPGLRIPDDAVTKISTPMEEEPYNPGITTDSGIDVGSGPGKTPLNTPSTDILDPLPTSTVTVDTQPQANVAEPTVKFGPLTDLEKDPHSPGQISPPNYQTKVVDPTGKGGAEAEVAPLVERLGDLHVDDKSEGRSRHDEFASEPTPISEQLKAETEPKSFDADRPESMPRDTVTGKITSVTAVIADKASTAKDVIASKLGYGGSGNQRQEGQESSKPTLESVSEYVAAKLGPVYEEAAGAGSAVMSKVQGRSGGEVSGGGCVVAKEKSDKGVSVQQYLAEKLSPGDEDKELSKVITDAIHRKKERAAEDEVKEIGEGDRVKETVRIEAIAKDEKAAAGVVDRVKGAIGSWLGKNHEEGEGEGLENAQVTRVQEKTGN